MTTTTPTPRRLRRRRLAGYHLPAGAVYVGRPTPWGNPFRVDGGRTAEEAVELYRQHLLSGLLRVTPEQAREQLRGKNLVCWCPLDQPCHADVLLAIANERR